MNTSSSPSQRRWRCTLAAGIVFTLLLAACGSSADDDAATSTDQSVAEGSTTETISTDDGTAAGSGDGIASTNGVDIGLFFDGAMAEEATTEDCTLSGGAEIT